MDFQNLRESDFPDGWVTACCERPAQPIESSKPLPPTPVYRFLVQMGLLPVSRNVVWVSAHRAYLKFLEWSVKNGEPPMTMTKFGLLMKKCAKVKRRTAGMVYLLERDIR